jgi:phage terminase small subunit
MGTNRGGGRRPTPTHLAIVDKAHQHRHYNQPSPSKDWPEAPERLSEAAKAIFDNLVETIAELYPPSASHVEMLALYAEHKELAVFLDAFLRGYDEEEDKETCELKRVYRGLTYLSGNGMIRSRPEVQMLKDERKACTDILREFGLSPSAQRSVKVEKKQAVKNAFADLDETG